MKALIVFLVGMTAGIGVMRFTEYSSANQLRLMAFFLLGVLIGMIATAICFWGWLHGE